MKEIKVKIHCDDKTCFACSLTDRKNIIYCTLFKTQLNWGEVYPIRCRECLAAEVKA